ncbi:MAG TPA: hypothetical protein VN924_21440 [Bryobacteraceae bacterium]|nr:hypothetical protein [Bryobacteraceae bacterium]
MIAPASSAVRYVLHDLKQPRGNGLGRLISRPDQNHARDGTATGGQEIAKIKVACQNRSLLPDSFSHDLIVRHGMEALLAKMHHLFACFT